MRSPRQRNRIIALFVSLFPVLAVLGFPSTNLVIALAASATPSLPEERAANVSTNAPPIQIELLPLSSPFIESEGFRLRAHTNALHWTWECGNGRARFGQSFSATADLNRDGYRDLAIGAFGYGREAANPPGLVLIFSGSKGGFQPHEPQRLAGPVGLAGFGRRVLGIRDDTGRRSDSLWVEAYLRRRGSNLTEQLMMFSGSSTGLHHTAYGTWSAYSNATFGTDFDCAGDVNGDGLNDFIIGGSTSTRTTGGEGMAFILHGGRDGPSTELRWSFRTGEAAAEFGTHVAGAGDVNGDGFSDVLVSSPIHPARGEKKGRVWLFLGSKTGVETNYSLVLDGPTQNSAFGECLATAGDLDGDGCSEFLVSAPGLRNRTSWRGEVTLFRGATNPAAIKRVWVSMADSSDYRWGDGMAVVGDVDGDAFPDLVIGAPNSYPGSRARGQVMLFRGIKGSFSESPDWILSATNEGRILGRLVQSLGDINGDRLADFAIGTPGWMTPREDAGGRIDVFLGSRTGYRRGQVFPGNGVNSIQIPPPNGNNAPITNKLSTSRNAVSLNPAPVHEHTLPQRRLFWQTPMGITLATLSVTGLLLGFWWTTAVKRRRAIEKERARLARDLHDHLGPQLSRIALLSNQSPADAPGPEVGSAAREAMESMRELVWATNPKNDSLCNFADFLADYASRYFRDTPVRTQVDIPLNLPRIQVQPDLRHNLFLVIKETLQNALRHSGAETVHLKLRLEQTTLRVLIHDNGRGFVQNAAAKSSPLDGGHGLENIHHRITQVGGSVQISSTPGAGTQTEIKVQLS